MALRADFLYRNEPKSLRRCGKQDQTSFASLSEVWLSMHRFSWQLTFLREIFLKGLDTLLNGNPTNRLVAYTSSGTDGRTDVVAISATIFTS